MKNLTIEKKIVTLVVFFSLFLVLSSQYQFYTNNVSQFIKAKKAKDKLLLETIVPIVNLNTSLELYDASQEYLLPILENNKDIELIILEENGREKVYLSLQEIDISSIKSYKKRNFSYKDIQDTYTNEAIGRISIYSSDKEYQFMLSQNINSTIYVFFAMIILMLILIFTIKREFKHLKTLSSEVLKYNPKESNFHLKEMQRNDEVGIINNAIISMLQKINDYSKLLDTMNQSLEKKVQERTKELEYQKLQALKATKTKSEFLANMSHEIRTPMNGVLGMTHLALQTELNEKQQTYISKIEKSAKSLLGIINDILDFSKIEAGKLNIEKVDFDLFQMIDSIVNLVEIKAIDKKLELIINYDENIHKDFSGDELRIAQILTNLIGNAIKFTEVGEIKLNIKKIANEKYRFEVIDTGIGLNKDEQERLFQSFSQADESTTRKYGGTGLGLTISKQLVELMDGEIWIESKKDIGSKFIFEIPLKEKENQIAFEQFSGKKILIVDNYNSNHQMLSDILRKFSIKTDHAYDAQDALQKTYECEVVYDLILMNWDLPETNGIEATQIIQKMCNNCSQKSSCKKVLPSCVIMTSSFNKEIIRKSARDAGIDIFLQKPINPLYLNDLLSKIFLNKSSIKEHLDTSKKIENIQFISGNKILLVEDNEINQDIILGLLEDSGITIDVANNGLEAVNIIRNNLNSYKLILMDIQMPIMDGYEATKHIQELNDSIPIIALTANVMKQDIEKAKQIGMSGHLKKPIEIQKLYSVLIKYIPEEENPTLILKKEKELSFLPNLKFIDTKIGLNHLAGNQKIYINILKDFRKKYEYLKITELQSEESKRTIHTIKGLAGNIGAQELYEISCQLNNTLNRNQLLSFHTALEKVITELKEHFINDIDVQKPILTPELKENLFAELKKATLTKRLNLITPVVKKLSEYDLSGEKNEDIRQLITLLKKYQIKDAVILASS